MRTIRDTLYDSLFVNLPPYMGELLREHEAEVFPGKTAFQHFLREGDSQKRVEKAKQILLRLAFESELLLPNQFVTALHSAEEEDAPKTASANYTPQDHFVHLVNLYLLGIYIYTYHKKLNRSLTRFFQGLRHNTSIELKTLSEEAAFLDFMFSWRAFVLIHDVGYAWELPCEGGKAIEDSRNLWHLIPDLMTKELASCFLARMTAWKSADSENGEVRLEQAIKPSLLRPAVKRSTPEFPFVNELKDQINLPSSARRIPTIHGNRFLSTLTSLVKPSDLIALLVHRRLGDVSCALIPDNSGKHHVIRIGSFGSHTDASLIRMAFSEGRTPRTGADCNFEWHLFCLDYELLRKKFCDDLRTITGGECSSSGIERACDEFFEETPAQLTITSDRDYRDSEFAAYEIIADFSRKRFETRSAKKRSRYSIVNQIALRHERDIARMLAGTIEQRINEQLRQVRDNGESFAMHGGIRALLEIALKPLKNIKSLSEDCARLFGADIQRSVEKEFHRHRIYDELLEVAGKCIGSPKTTPLKVFRVARLSSADLEPVKSMTSRVDVILKAAGAPSLSALLDDYRPEFLPPNSMDHGLAAAVYAMHIAINLDRVLGVVNPSASKNTDAGNTEMLCKFSQVALSLGEQVQADEARYQTHVLMDYVVSAVALHNLYPCYVKPLQAAQFRVELRRAPFSYFAMLCDALQTWDRDRRIMQSRHTMPYKASNDTTNIIVEDDMIKITECDHGLDISKRAQQLKAGLESYLHGSSHFLKIELGEWRR